MWDGSTNGNGYGTLHMGGQTFYVHRLAYAEVHGPIPDDLQIDHLCRRTLCLEPAHLEAVSQRENLLRGLTLTAANAAKTHCPAGHSYEGENLYVDRAGSRHCRACRAERRKARRG